MVKDTIQLERLFPSEKFELCLARNVYWIPFDYLGKCSYPFEEMVAMIEESPSIKCRKIKTIADAISLFVVSEFKEISDTRYKIIDGIQKFELTKKRMDIVEKNGIKIINDAYNASYESMTASLKYLATFKENRKIAVLGDMFELGKYSEELHRNVGREVVKNDIDLLICCGENSKFIEEQAKIEGMEESKIYYFEEKTDILDLLKSKMKRGDIILFKASNGMKFFDLATQLEKIVEKFEN